MMEWSNESHYLGICLEILLPLPEIEPRSPSIPAPSQTLYYLSYPAYNNRMYLTKIWCKDVNCIKMAQDGFQCRSFKYGNEFSGSIKGRKIHD
jgi:hypothetical protein